MARIAGIEFRLVIIRIEGGVHLYPSPIHFHPTVDFVGGTRKGPFLTIHKNYSECLNKLQSKNIYAITKFGKKSYTDVKFQLGDSILFGSETKGLPSSITNQFPEKKKLFIPMIRNSRSLNLSNAVSLVLYEAWRQEKFISSVKIE